MEFFGKDTINKFGRTVGIDNNVIPADIWDIPKLYEYIDIAEDLYLSSSNTNDNQLVIINGMDNDGFAVQTQASLTGYIPVKIPIKLFRTWRMLTYNSANTLGDVYLSTGGDPEEYTLGVPDDLDTVQAKFLKEFQQTRMSLYTVPINKTGYLRYIYFNLLPKNVQHVAASITVFSRDIQRRPSMGGNWRGQGDAGLITTGTSFIQRIWIKGDEPPITSLTDLRLTCTLLTSNDADISCGFGIRLVDNE